jgi:hypothetical protein
LWIFACKGFNDAEDLADETINRVMFRLEAGFTLRKFQDMPEICRKISRYAGQKFHLMPEWSA